MRMRKAVLLVLILISGVAGAQVGWKDGDGNPVPDTENQKSVAGFGGLLVVTPDEDWEEKWNTPPEVGPQFSHASTVEMGGRLFILTIFTNPQVDDAGAAHVTIDIDIKRPDGSSSMHTADALCFQGEPGPLHNLYLCGPVVGFLREPSDPAGTWSVQIGLTDEIRKVSMSLATHFELRSDAR